MSLNPDRSALKTAALKVGVRIAVVCAVMVVALTLAAALFLLQQARHPDPGGTAGAVRVFVDYNDVLKAMILAGAGGIVLAGVAGWLSARSAIRPLADALAMQRRFVQDASHELRTPLTILDARIQLAQRQVPDGSELAGLLDQVRRDTGALTATVEELLLAATAGAPARAAEPVDAAGVAASAVADLRQTATDRGVSLNFSGAGEARTRIAENSLRRAVLALLDNALSHTPGGGQVSVATARQGARVVLTVADTGPGISGVDRERIFERFARSATPASSGQRSFGIGLALVREIAVNAGGTVEVSATGPSGTTMTLSLPAG
ncbi:MAG: sensor histidine kinase [Actinomycetales bacterium]|jgi:signal transduction histidine kinase